MAERKADKFATKKGSVANKVKNSREERQRKMCNALEMSYNQSTGRCKKR